MTKERFIVIMTALKERLKARDEFLDMTYEFCGGRFEKRKSFNGLALLLCF